jgi:hypothetical protein
MISLLLAVTVAGVQVQGAAPPAPAAAQVETAAERKARLREEKAQTVVCKRVVATGSSLPSRQCMTNAEWTEYTREAKDAAQKIQNDNLNLYSRR